MPDSFPRWVDEAVDLPIAFAQVREDPRLDRWVVEHLTDGARVALVASGGCTAAVLATAANVGRLHLVDANPAQIALSRLKLHLLSEDSDTRRAILGHADSIDPPVRKAHISKELHALGYQSNVLGPTDFVARVGPDYAGRYERVFAALQDSLGDCKSDLDALLRLHDPDDQARRVQENTPLGRQLDDALDTVMALPNLVRLFGEEATKNPVEPFARHFARRIRHVIARLPASDNPYLWQMLKGCYPANTFAPWLTLAAPTRLPEITWSNAFMADALSAEPAAFDFVHLSNILDWLSPEKASATLDVAWRALRPGGWTLIRQLNSSLDIPSLGDMFDWQTRTADDLHARDRSFFYRALHLGRRR